MAVASARFGRWTPARLRERAAQLAGAMGLAGLLLTSGCASASRMMGYRPSRTLDEGRATTEAEGFAGTDARPAPAGDVDAALEASRRPGQDALAAVKAVAGELPEEPEIRLASAEIETPALEAAPALEPPSWAPDLTVAPASVGAPRLNDAAIAAAICHPPTARQELPAAVCPPWADCPSGACPSGSCPPMACPPGLSEGPRPFPQEDGSDEYVCDGGDLGDAVHFEEGGGLGGIESEDTVAEFVDEEGRRQLRASNRVCVYAPRFGVARSVEGPIASQDVDKAAGAHDGVLLAGYSHRMAPDEQVDRDALHKLQARDRSSGLVNREAEWAFSHGEAALENVKLVNAFEDFSFILRGEFNAGEAAELYKRAVAAGEWTIDQPPVVVAETLQGQEVKAQFNVAEYIGAEDMRTPGELRLVKLADRNSARLGETVQFTLRFDNLGDRELRRVRIVDHLSPRLQLLDESVHCDLPGELEVAEGATGGEVLTFTLDEPLAGGAGGSISFECRVR